jgi:hypothetical protein
VKTSKRLLKKLATFKAWKKRNPDYFKIWAKKNREKCRAAVEKWRRKNKKYCANKMKERRISHPWEQSHYAARNRCTNPNSEKFKTYGARGIIFKLKISQTKKIWIRDKAHLLKKPSIDRIDNDGNYQISNCRFIETSENSARSNRMRKCLK